MGFVENVIYLIALSIAESIFFPIPPDVLLLYYGIEDPKNWFLYATITTISSVIGGVLGYSIGKYFRGWIKSKVKEVEEVEKLYHKYGDYAVFISGFSPIPYKVFTISSGILNFDLKRFIVYSTIARGARFYAVSFLSANYGKEVAEAIINDPIIGLGLMVIGLILAYLIKRFMDKIIEG